MELILRNQAATLVAAVTMGIMSIVFNFDTDINAPNKTQNMITENSVSYIEQVTTQEKIEFNRKWEKYKGKQKGIVVKELLDELIENADFDEYDERRLPDLVYEATADDIKFNVVSTVKKKNEKEFISAKEEIQEKHEYYIILEYDDADYVSNIKIEYSEPIFGD